MRVLIIANEDHAKARAYAEHRRAAGDEVRFGSILELTSDDEGVVIPAEDPDAQEMAANLKQAGKRVAILGADAHGDVDKQNSADGETDASGVESTGTDVRVSSRSRRKTESAG